MQQVVKAAIEQQVLRAAQEVESQIDAELHKLETLEEDDLERLRQRRIDELKRCEAWRALVAAAARCRRRLHRPPPPPPAPPTAAACRLQQKRQEWAQKGHGEYSEIDEKDFFKVGMRAAAEPGDVPAASAAARAGCLAAAIPAAPLFRHNRSCGQLVHARCQPA